MSLVCHISRQPPGFNTDTDSRCCKYATQVDIRLGITLAQILYVVSMPRNTVPDSSCRKYATPVVIYLHITLAQILDVVNTQNSRDPSVHNTDPDSRM